MTNLFGQHLLNAVTKNNINLLKNLIHSEVDLNQDLGNGNTALHIAAGNGFYALVYLMLENGANVHAINHRGFTPLDCAVNVNCLEIIGTLIYYGAENTAYASSVSSRKGLSNKIKVGAYITAEIDRKLRGGRDQERLHDVAVRAFQQANQSTTERSNQEPPRAAAKVQHERDANSQPNRRR